MTDRERPDLHLIVGGLAHDFNNLLMVIEAFGDLAQRRLTPADPSWSDLEQILRATARAQELARQLLAAACPTSPTKRAVDLRALLDDMLPMLSRVLGERIELSVRCPRDVHVAAAPSQLERVVLNLVLNARDAMIDGGHLSIAVFGIEVDGPQVVLAVTDTGMGIDGAARERMFEPFFTTKEHGTGLGLSTVLAIVREAGGSIQAHSERGRGTTFSVRLPRVRRGASVIDDPRA